MQIDREALFKAITAYLSADAGHEASLDAAVAEYTGAAGEGAVPVGWRWRAFNEETRKPTCWVYWESKPVRGINLTEDADVEIEPLYAAPPPPSQDGAREGELLRELDYHIAGSDNGLSKVPREFLTRLRQSLTIPPVSKADEGESLVLGEPCTLDDCPPGLFMTESGSFGFMSEYSTLVRDGRFRQRDAYVVGSGEYFWGGTSDPTERAELIVRPVIITTLLSELERVGKDFHAAANAASEYSEFWERHHGDFDAAGNYLPHSQIDGDLHAAEARVLKAQALVVEAVKTAEEAVTQIKYLHTKFQETGSGNNVIGRLNAFLDRAKDTTNAK